MTSIPSPSGSAGPASAAPVPRDYTLTGDSSRRAVETGLAAAEWYHTEVPRKVMKELMARTDGPALNGALAGTGMLLAVFSVLLAAGLVIG